MWELCQVADVRQWSKHTTSPHCYNRTNKSVNLWMQPFIVCYHWVVLLKVFPLKHPKLSTYSYTVINQSNPVGIRTLTPQINFLLRWKGVCVFWGEAIPQSCVLHVDTSLFTPRCNSSRLSECRRRGDGKEREEDQGSVTIQTLKQCCFAGARSAMMSTCTVQKLIRKTTQPGNPKAIWPLCTPICVASRPKLADSVFRWRFTT